MLTQRKFSSSLHKTKKKTLPLLLNIIILVLGFRGPLLGRDLHRKRSGKRFKIQVPTRDLSDPVSVVLHR